MTHLDTWNTSYGQKNGHESKFWFLTTKSQELPQFPYVQMTCNILLKSSQYNFALDFISIGDLHTKLWAPKIMGVSTLGISELPNTWESWNKMTFGCWSHAKHKVYYKGEGGDFPQVRAVVSLVSPCIKVLQLRTNQFVVWFVQVCVSKWIAYHSS